MSPGASLEAGIYFTHLKPGSSEKSYRINGIYQPMHTAVYSFASNMRKKGTYSGAGQPLCGTR
jgi:hypothetical protein